MDLLNQVQILDDATFISLHTDVQTRLFSLGKATGLEDGKKTEFKTWGVLRESVTHWCIILLSAHPKKNLADFTEVFATINI